MGERTAGRITTLSVTNGASLKVPHDQAGKQVGGKKGDKVRAAIEAIPKVSLVVDYCKAVTAGYTGAPVFSHQIGLGCYGSVSSPSAFKIHVGQMNGYHRTFTAMQLK